MRDTALPFVLDGIDPDTRARAGTIQTRRGAIRTPIFMPVGTLGTVKTLSPDEIAGTSAEILLANTYHLYLRPGTEVLEHFGGLHRFMDWPGPILTDSGGYQFFSLAKLAKFTEDGVRFQSHHDGSRHVFTPERVIEIQRAIGSDIMMQLDQCAALPADRRTLEAAMRRTTAWARRSVASRRETDGALFGIVQGGTEIDLRLRHVEELSALPLDGLALGGLAVGEPPAQMYDTIEAVAPTMPVDRPRYLMGVGRPEDLLAAIARGIDMFDCVMPTRNARNAQVFTRTGRLNLRNARHVRDDRPLDPGCRCLACRRFSRGYVHHLFRNEEVLGLRLTTLHNVTYYLDLVRGAREAILDGRHASWEREVRSNWDAGGSVRGGESG